MLLVQNMEVAEDRDSEQYADRLSRILSVKDEAVTALRAEISQFKLFRSKDSSGAGGSASRS